MYVQQSQLAAKLINRYGGNIEVLMLRNDAGLKSSTHMPLAGMVSTRMGPSYSVLVLTDDDSLPCM